MQLVEKTDKPEPKRVTVAVLLFDGAQIIDYAGPWEAFGEAGFKIFTVAEKPDVVAAVYGQNIKPDYTFENSPAADVLLVPGGGGSRIAIENAKLIKWVQKNAQSSQHVMSVCTGAFILARAGLLDGLSATTVSGGLERLAELAPKTKVVDDRRYVDNGKVITTAGLSSGIDGAFHLIAKINGMGAAQKAALGMEYNWDPDSKFARAALADRYFPDVNVAEGEVVSTVGDTNHWEFRVLLSKPASAGEIIDLIGKSVTTATPHVRGAVTLLPSTNNKSEIGWKFTDDQGRDWEGSGMVEPASGQPGKFMVTLKLRRPGQGQST